MLYACSARESTHLWRKNVPIYFLSFLSDEDSYEYSSMSEQVDCFGRADESQSHWKMKGNYGGPNFKKSFWKGGWNQLSTHKPQTCPHFLDILVLIIRFFKSHLNLT